MGGWIRWAPPSFGRAAALFLAVILTAASGGTIVCVSKPKRAEYG